MSEKIRELVDKFKQHCLEIKSVFNEKLERDCYSNIRYIFVGDNPGDSEKLANEVLSVPIFPGMTEVETDRVIDAVSDFQN